MRDRPSISDKVPDIGKRISPKSMWEVREPGDILVIEEGTLLIMSEYDKVYHLSIVSLEKSKLFTKDDLISEIVRSCRGHEKDFLLLIHAPIIEESDFLCKFAHASRSTLYIIHF